MSGRMTPLVQAEGLGKTYADGPTEVQVLRGLDLVITPGESVAIMGESGVGKSTLLHILGLLDGPTTGRLIFDGTDVLRLSEAEQAALRNRSVGFVFQFHHLLPDFTAVENVMLPALIGREPASAARARAEQLLERVGLVDRRDHRPGEMSGGEQQRVAVARAVMRRPRLLLADEPTGSLDPATGDRVQALMMELNADAGSSLVIATHNARLAATMGRTLRLVDGRLEDTTAAVEGRRGTASGV
jgi:lipoprotein-releasing system ATP-binding protein